MSDSSRLPDGRADVAGSRWISAARRLAGPLGALGWAILLAVLLLAPGRGVDRPPWPWLGWLAPWADKIAHAALFFVLALLLRRWWEGRGSGRPLVAAIAAAILYGVGLEALQALVPRRSPEVLDGVADALGALAAALPARRRGGREPATVPAPVGVGGDGGGHGGPPLRGERAPRGDEGIESEGR